VRRYVVRNALPLDEITAAPAIAEPWLRSGDSLVLFAGRMDEGKNATMIVQALSQLNPRLSVRALLCGDGPEREHLERLVRAAGLENSIRVRGYVSNLWGLMKIAQLFVSPSRFEGSPNVVLEAMACECPLVVSDIPAHRELLDEYSAVLVPPDDLTALTRAIETVLRDPTAARRRARLARERAARLTPRAAAEQYMAIYRETVSRISRRSSGRRL
jgi:glycosyltransferase involved in cell wall biosynthesis